jgi:membrane-associated phospholipid phosphatase
MNIDELWEKITNASTDTVEDIGDILQYALPVLGLLSAVIMGNAGMWDAWLYALGGQAGLSTILKRLFNFTSIGTRPNGGDNAMPSGHTTAAFMGATFVYLSGAAPIAVVGAYVLAAFTGYSRVRANKHWWRDVFVGAMLGAATSVAAVFLA